MLGRSKLNKLYQQAEQNSRKEKRLEQQLGKCGFDLSNSQCSCTISPHIRQCINKQVVFIQITPRVGVFKSITFTVMMLYCHNKMSEGPTFYNNKRILHPNININTCEVVFPQAKNKWKITNKQIIPHTSVLSLIQSIRDTLTQPNLHFVPNTSRNKTAAWHYYFQRKQYHNLLNAHTPQQLDNKIAIEMDEQWHNGMQVQAEGGTSSSDEFWTIESILPKLLREDDEEQWSVSLLTKKIKVFSVSEDGMDVQQTL